MGDSGPAHSHRLLFFRLAGLAVVCLLALAAVGSSAVLRIAQRGSAPLTTAQVVKLVQPSVVAVSVTPFRSDPREGSGFVFGATGRILTSARLLARALSVSVMDSTGVTYSATVIGVDRQTGVAQLEVNSLRVKPIKPAPGPASVGTKVLVIDNPDGFLTHDVTQGAVSDTSSTLAVDKTTTYQNLLKTGAASTAGDTGGPLVNGAGQLVGMVTTDATNHALGIPLASFAADAHTWTLSSAPLDLGPPMVTATPGSLVLPSIGGGWARAIFSGDTTTWHTRWEKAPTYTYGGESVDIFIYVAATEFDSQDAYQKQISFSNGKGYTTAGPVPGLGDEATALVKSVSDQLTFAVVWRDRNVKVIVFMGAGIPAPPDVNLQNTLGVAFAEGAIVGADLANYQ